MFNPKKTQVKTPLWEFYGCLYDESGVHPDPQKVNAVHALPTPTNITELQEFLGMVTCPRPFIPCLSTLTAPFLSCSKKMLNSAGMPPTKQPFQCVKDIVVSDTTLQYFDASYPITDQVDASEVGLGAALLQDNKPVAFTSKALT